MNIGYSKRKKIQENLYSMCWGLDKRFKLVMNIYLVFDDEKDFYDVTEYGGHEAGPAHNQQPPGLQDGELLMVHLHGSLNVILASFRLLSMWLVAFKDKNHQLRKIVDNTNSCRMKYLIHLLKMHNIFKKLQYSLFMYCFNPSTHCRGLSCLFKCFLKNFF